MTTVLREPRTVDDLEGAGEHRVYTTADLRRLGMTKRDIGRIVDGAALVRVHRGLYLAPDAPAPVVHAARTGGRVGCVSALLLAGVFVLTVRDVHLHYERGASPGRSTGVRHWERLARRPHPRAVVVHIIDALIQATNCQSPRAAVASLDSALHLGLIDDDDLDEIFARVAPRRRVLRRYLDGRAESGPESIVRMMAVLLGFRVEVQVRVRGVGRVDLVLDGWLVVECDSEQFHVGWPMQKKDRRRDLALAARGFVTMRPIAEDIMYNPDVVIAALIGLRDAHARTGRADGVPNSGRM